MVGIAPDFARVTRQRRNQITNLRDTQFHQQVGMGHLSPKFRLDHVAVETGGQGLERVQNQKMRAAMHGMPVMLMRNKYRAGTLYRQDFGNDPGHFFPIRAVLLP